MGRELRVVADGQVSIGALARRQTPVSEVHLYSADLDELSSSPCRDLITVGEVEQACRFPTALLRQRFIGARALTRAVLASYVGGGASNLRFDRSCPDCGAQDGKPRLDSNAHPGSGTEFSVSRSGSLCLLAVSAGQVGVDVEVLRNLSSEAIATKEFSESEADYIRRLPSAARVKGFLELWVRKEALAKAVGTGLTREMLTTCVLGQPAQVRLAEHGSWTVLDVRLGRQSRAAVAVRPHLQTIRVLTAVG